MAAEKKRKLSHYVTASIVVAGGAAVLAPKIIEVLSRELGKAEKPSQTVDYEKDDWGPEIVKRED